jgi:glycosyltransferase involved in cell wall biosynthesis
LCHYISKICKKVTVSSSTAQYNSEKYISETIESALNQIYKNIEIIVVDDHSTDNSFNIARNYTQRFPDIVKLFSNPRKGACAARNYGFEKSKGDFIQYLDADDLLSPNKIEEQLKLIKDKPDVIANCTWQYFHNIIGDTKNKKQSIDKDYDNPTQWLIDSWDGKGMGLIHNWLTPNQLIEKAGPWNEELLINQDGEFFCRVLLHSKKIKYSNKSIVYYRRGLTNSISNANAYNKLKSQLYSFDLYYEHIVNHDVVSNNTKEALHSVFSDFYIRTIYEFPDLANEALKRINNLGYNKVKIQGGKIFQLFSKLLGIKNTIILRQFLLHR